ncbi:MAG: hypothetical protein ACXVAZ_14115, partial [Mucilaginibacter sp.]
HLLIYQNILGQLKDTGRLTKRRIDAATKILWPLAHWIAKDFPEDGKKTADWIYELDPDFKIPEKGALEWLYRTIGFKGTEKILRVRRSIANVFR